MFIFNKSYSITLFYHFIIYLYFLYVYKSNKNIFKMNNHQIEKYKTLKMIVLSFMSSVKPEIIYK